MTDTQTEAKTNADEIKAKLLEIEAAKLKEFETAYAQMVEDYKCQLVPVIQIIPGELPSAVLTTRQIKE